MYSLHYILMKTHMNMHRNLSGKAAAIGLTSGKPKVLECLADFGEANQKSIAQYCEIEQATVGTILLGMEKEGLITRRQKDGNRRSLYVSLTPKGKQAAADMENIFKEADEEAVRYLTEEEEQQLKTLLEKVYTALTENGDAAL